MRSAVPRIFCRMQIMQGFSRSLSRRCEVCCYYLCTAYFIFFTIFCCWIGLLFEIVNHFQLQALLNCSRCALIHVRRKRARPEWCFFPLTHWKSHPLKSLRRPLSHIFVQFVNKRWFCFMFRFDIRLFFVGYGAVLVQSSLFRYGKTQTGNNMMKYFRQMHDWTFQLESSFALHISKNKAISTFLSLRFSQRQGVALWAVQIERFGEY